MGEIQVTEATRFRGGWGTNPVSEFGEIVTGGTPHTGDQSFWGGPYPWVTPTDISSSRDISTSARMITEAGLNSIRVLPADSVLVTCIASIGKNAVLRAEGGCNQQINAIIPNPRYSAEFIYYLFEYNVAYLLAKAGTTATPIVSKNAFSRLRIRTPPLPEQRAIAAVLSDVDGLIGSLEALIAKKRAIKQAAMQELLTGRTRLPGFGGEWEQCTLGKLAHIATGNRNNQDKRHDGQYPFFVRSSSIERIDSYSYDGEAILIPGEGRIGEIFHYVHGRFDVHQRVYAVSNVVSSVSVRFLYFYLAEFFGSHAMQNTVKATVDSLRLPTFQAFPLHLPPLPEQRAIATILSDMDSEITALERRLEKTRAIKQGMMQQLLTGAIRLPIPSVDGKADP